jgi:hypothetical protein
MGYSAIRQAAPTCTRARERRPPGPTLPGQENGYGRRTGQLLDCGRWKQRRTCARWRAEGRSFWKIMILSRLDQMADAESFQDCGKVRIGNVTFICP